MTICWIKDKNKTPLHRPIDHRRRFFLVLLLCFCCAIHLQAQADKRLSVEINFKKGYVTGVCMMSDEAENVRGTIMNEFGIKVFDFVYRKETKKLKLFNVIAMLDKWYIKHVLRKDMKHIIPCLLAASECRYRNDKQQIDYLFTPL